MNIPYLNNKEYEKVVKRYKAKGQEATTKLGSTLVNDDLKKQRIDHWRNHINDNPGSYVFCNKGGIKV